MENVSRLIERLKVDGFELWLERGELRFRAPTGTVTSERLGALRSRKAEVISFLSSQEDAREEPALTARGSEGLHPLTMAQAAFVQRYPGLKALRSHHIPFSLRVTPSIDIGVLQDAIAQLLTRHTILRARYDTVDGTLCARIDESLHIPIEQVDISAMDYARQEAALPGILSQALLARFDLGRGPIVRALLVTRSAQESLVAFITHHSVSDAWTVRILVSDLAACIRAACAGMSAPLPKLPVQFTDYAHWQKLWLASHAGQRQLSYWKNVIAGVTLPFWIPPDRVPPNAESMPVVSWLDRETRSRLQEYARCEHSTLFVIVLAAFAMMLARWSRRDDVLITVAHSGRLRPEVHELAGCFIQKWLLRVDLAGCSDIQDAFERVRCKYQDAMRHLQMPYSTIRQELVSQCGEDALLDITVNYIPEMRKVAGAAADMSLPVRRHIVMDNRYWGADDARMESNAGGGRLFAKFFEEDAGGLTWSFRFPEGLFAEGTVAGASAAFRQLLQGLAGRLP